MLIRDIHSSQHSEGDGRGLSVSAMMNLQGSWERGGKRDTDGCMERKKEGVTVIVSKEDMKEQEPRGISGIVTAHHKQR